MSDHVTPALLVYIIASEAVSLTLVTDMILLKCAAIAIIGIIARCHERNKLQLVLQHGIGPRL